MSGRGPRPASPDRGATLPSKASSNSRAGKLVLPHQPSAPQEGGYNPTGGLSSQFPRQALIGLHGRNAQGTRSRCPGHPARAA